MKNLERSAFRGTQRFLIEGELGSGGFGVVYRAYDRQRNAVVALKRLPWSDPEMLYRFKQEFRTLAGISHPNLVSLYELISEESDWFFTMELVEGTTFLHYVRSSGSIIEEPTEVLPLPNFDGKPLKPQRRQRAEQATLDYDRIRDPFFQPARGVKAMQNAGKLHRGIKPPNIGVTDERRVVLLDFGLAMDLLRDRERPHPNASIEGTPDYMSPEQAADKILTPASDWYGVGIVLFEALTGILPFSCDSPLEVLKRKNTESAPKPSAFLDGIPEDIDTLCAKLLERDPAKRPSGSEILSRLGGSREVRVESRARHDFVGRHSQRLQLQLALEEVHRTQRPGVVFVSGRPGMGKSSLIQDFTSSVMSSDPKTLVIAGRCYESESVPFKALDSAIDSLTRQIRRMPRGEMQQLLPNGTEAIARLFPVFRTINVRNEPSEQPRDPQEIRRRSVLSFTDLIQRLTRTRSFVIVIDDVHWGDIDSAQLLGEILRQTNAPPMLLVLSFREESRRNRFVETLNRNIRNKREIVVDALSSNEARMFAAQALGTSMTDPVVQRIVEEAGGSPLFIEELVSHVACGGEEGAGGVRLEDVILARVHALPSDARALAETIAIAGHPVTDEVAKTVAGIDNTMLSARGVLATRQMIRIYRTPDGELYETYHDRIREAITESLPEERLREIHLRLAQTLAAAMGGETETIATHFLEGGDRERAFEYFRDAAAESVAALAFDRAVTLYRTAMELSPVENDGRQELRVRYAEALASSGRGAEAGHAYVRAASTAKPCAVMDLKRNAAEQFLRSGHIDEGIEQISAVLAECGMSLARIPRREYLSFILRREIRRARGTHFKPGRAEGISPWPLRRVDVWWSVATGLALVDTFRGADYQSRQMLLALKAGEPYHVARAMAMEAGYSSADGWRARERTAVLLERARVLASETGHPHAIGLVEMVDGIAAVLEGRWLDGLDRCGLAAATLRERCTNVTWERFNADIYALIALMWLGRFGELAVRIPAVMDEASDRGDLYAETYIRSALQWPLRLVEDKPDEARSDEERAMAVWSHAGYHINHYHDLLAGSEILLYRGDAIGAWQRLDARWKDLKKSMLLSVQIVRIESAFLKARCAMAAANATRDQHLHQIARQETSRLSSERGPWGPALGSLLLAAMAINEGDASEAQKLEKAEQLLNAVDMKLHAMIARRQRGVLVGDSGMVFSATTAMQNEGVKNPDRYSRHWLPISR